MDGCNNLSGLTGTKWTERPQKPSWTSGFMSSLRTRQCRDDLWEEGMWVDYWDNVLLVNLGIHAELTLAL